MDFTAGETPHSSLALMILLSWVTRRLQGSSKSIQDPDNTNILFYCYLHLSSPPGMVSEPKSKIPPERESDVGQPVSITPQILHPRHSHRAARRSPAHHPQPRLSILVKHHPLQVGSSSFPPFLPPSLPPPSLLLRFPEPTPAPG